MFRVSMLLKIAFSENYLWNLVQSQWNAL